MPTPVSESIVQTIQTRLESITTANGYSLNVSGVHRVNRHDVDSAPNHLAIHLIAAELERNTAHDCPGNPPTTAYRLPVQIHGFVRLPDRTNLTEDEVVNDFAADIRKAITSTTNWHRMGGFAYLADWGVETKFESVDHFGFTLELSVMYRTPENDPYTVTA